MKKNRQAISKTLKNFFLLLTMLLIAGCGFHLRGYNLVPPQLHVLYLDSSVPYDPLVVQLRYEFRTLGTIVVEHPKEAPITLRIVNVVFEKRVTNISSNTFVRSYLLVYELVFELIEPDGRIIYGPETVLTETSYSSNDNQLLGDDMVLQQQKIQMRRDLLMKLFYRLNSKTGQAALSRLSE